MAGLGASHIAHNDAVRGMAVACACAHLSTTLFLGCLLVASQSHTSYLTISATALVVSEPAGLAADYHHNANNTSASLLPAEWPTTQRRGRVEAFPLCRRVPFPSHTEMEEACLPNGFWSTSQCVLQLFC